MDAFISIATFLVCSATLLGLINPSLFRIKWVKTRFRVFLTGFFLLALVLIVELYSNTMPENISLEDRITWHAKRFDRDGKIDVYTDENKTPIEYSVTVESFRDMSFVSIERRKYFESIIYSLRRISEDEILKDLKGTHEFVLRAETTSLSGFTDTSRVLTMSLPNNLRVNWDKMYRNSYAFLEFLNHESKYNYRVRVNWIYPELKPDDWY